jgi:hypothetical protein
MPNKKPKGRSKAYESKDVLIQTMLDIIKSNPDIIYFHEIFNKLPIVKRTYYKYVKESDPEHKLILEALDDNKMNMKAEIRKKLLNINNPTGLIALYKIIGDKDDREALANNPKPKQEEPINANIELKFS